VLGESEPISGLGLELAQIGFDVPQPARKNRASRAGRSRMDLRKGMEIVGMGMLLCLLGPTPALLKSFGILPLAARLREFLHSLNPNRGLESLARDVDAIGYPA
jgi:hypothetical protein